MKIVKLMLFTILITTFCVISSLAQPTATQKRIYEHIEVDKFSIKQGVEFPADKIEGVTQSVVDSLNDTNKFKSVALSDLPKTSDSAETKPIIETTRLKISGEIIKYEPGSQAKRYLLGMGAGKTKLIANIKFIDAQSGEVLFEEIVDGIVSWGLFGGDKNKAQNNLAKQIVKIAKEKFTDGKKAEKSNKDASKKIGTIKEN